MTLRFSQHIFHSDQFGYAKHARAFRTQINLIKKINADHAFRTQMGTLDTDSLKHLLIMRISFNLLNHVKEALNSFFKLNI